jgi:hypothetical protein
MTGRSGRFVGDKSAGWPTSPARRFLPALRPRRAARRYPPRAGDLSPPVP